MAPCPLLALRAIEIFVVGEDDKPVSDVGVELRNGAGKVQRSRTGRDGVVRFAGLEDCGHHVCLFDLDEPAWALEGSAPLSAEVARSHSLGAWEEAAPRGDGPKHHVVEECDCITRIAARYGYLPALLWQDSANEQLRALRKNPSVLAPGDVVSLPPKRVVERAVSPARRHSVRRRGVPELLRVRFLNAMGEARARVPYVLELSSVRGMPIPKRAGETDSDGFVREVLPPDAVEGILELGTPPLTERRRFRLGAVDPTVSTAGLRSRLVNLGHPCGSEVEPGPALESSLTRFQKEHGLEATGKPDEATRAAVEKAHLC